jgi:hypothetical protein
VSFLYGVSSWCAAARISWNSNVAIAYLYRNESA